MVIEVIVRGNYWYVWKFIHCLLLKNKKGKYSREETIWGNTILEIYEDHYHFDNIKYKITSIFPYPWYIQIQKADNLFLKIQAEKL